MANHPKFSLLECAFWIPADWPQGLRQTIGNDRDRLRGQYLLSHFYVMHRFITLRPVGGYWWRIKLTRNVLFMLPNDLKVPTYYSSLFREDSRLRCKSFASHTCSVFTFHPWLLMRSALGQSRPVCQHVMADLWAKGNGCILTWLFEKCQPLTVWSSAERCELARCEHAHQRRSSRHGNITRLYACCSPSNPQPSFTNYVSSLFLSQNMANVRQLIIFAWKMQQFCECGA